MGDSCHFEFWSAYWDVVKVLLWIGSVLGTLVGYVVVGYGVFQSVSWLIDRICEWWDKREGRRILKDEVTEQNTRLAESIEFAARLKPADAADFYGSIDARDEFIRRAQEAIKSNTVGIQGQGA